MFSDKDIFWMQRAIELAKLAAQNNEVPVGAVLVLNDQAIGESYNLPIGRNDPMAHAEVLALRTGAEKVKNYRLLNTILYVTLEPCLMCAGAMVHSRIERLVYGAFDAKTGAIVSQIKALDLPFLNHRVNHVGGLLADQCSELLTQFFKNKR